ncbi:MAG: heme ABC transporter permease [Gammaproteobacteria bacterium]|nr:heme ABC transporter permease [Gammaproteobacteria bacterium]NNC98103.1 heme ABC transporter permease [Gammaproteobacteria bacterium]NNM13167.1 heme ABC transporter permease [Gammaproteobacteria bacterium]
MKKWFHQWVSPPHLYERADRYASVFFVLAMIGMLIALYGGLVLAPPDYQQGDAFRIIYVHVPSAWLSMFAYAFMAGASLVALVWRFSAAHAVAASIAPVGAVFTAMCLLTGSFWGKPMWGTWWEWDARMTSELVLLLIYLAYMALRSAFAEQAKADKAAAIFALIGVVNLPIIHYSVYWWNTLHQGATVSKIGKPSITWDMGWPLLVMTIAFMLFFGAVVLMRTRGELLSRDRRTKWVREILMPEGGSH